MRVSADIAVKGYPVELKTSSDPTNRDWVNVTVEDNLDEPVDITQDPAPWTAPAIAAILEDGSLRGTGSVTAHLPFLPQNGFTSHHRPVLH